MVEINLIPWRFYLREYKQKRVKKLFVCGVFVVFLASAFFYGYVRIHPQSLRNVPIHSVPKIIPQHPSVPSFKYVGYLRQGKRFLALILLPSGKLLDAEVGSVLLELHGRVMSVNEKEIVVNIENQLVRVSHVAKN